MQKIFHIFSQLFETVTGKKLFYINPNEHNTLGRTAVWHSLGFWYVGDVFNSADIAYGIAQNGLVENEDTNLVVAILSEFRKERDNADLVFYDIGANTGYYGVLAATKFGADVFSFEPIRVHTECIEKSAYLNRVDMLVHIHQIALGREKDILPIKIAGSGSTLTNDFLGNSKAPIQQVPVETLDSLQLPAPFFIKIDVEGYEWEVLQGAKGTITKHKPICFIEIAKTFSARNFNHSHYDDIISFFKQQNYNIFINTADGLEPIKSDTTIPDGTAMFLFTPFGVNTQNYVAK